MAIHMECDGATDIGRMRDSNQDHFLIANLCKSLELYKTSLDVTDHTRLFGRSQGKLLLVADGMGGHAGGERASALAIDTVTTYVLNSLRWFLRLEADEEEDFVDDLKATLERCQQSIVAESESVPERRKMGTTLTMAYVIWPRVYVVHAGDSRCYLFRDSKLWQITRDHTMAQEFVDAGVLSEKEAEQSRWSHTLWNSIGGADDVQPEVYKAELSMGDALLLCSDGLTKHVDDEQIEEWLARSETAEIACRQLVETANQAGGSDNITVVVARFQEFNEEQTLAAEDKFASDATDVGLTHENRVSSGQR
jgi:protein phosphatase